MFANTKEKVVAILETIKHINMASYQIVGIIFIFVGIWFAFEIYRAPMMDEETGKVIKPGKKLSDLWRKRS